MLSVRADVTRCGVCRVEVFRSGLGAHPAQHAVNGAVDDQRRTSVGADLAPARNRGARVCQDLRDVGRDVRAVALQQFVADRRLERHDVAGLEVAVAVGMQHDPLFFVDARDEPEIETQEFLHHAQNGVGRFAERFELLVLCRGCGHPLACSHGSLVPRICAIPYGVVFRPYGYHRGALNRPEIHMLDALLAAITLPILAMTSGACAGPTITSAVGLAGRHQRRPDDLRRGDPGEECRLRRRTVFVAAVRSGLPGRNQGRPKGHAAARRRCNRPPSTTDSRVHRKPRPRSTHLRFTLTLSDPHGTPFTDCSSGDNGYRLNI